MDFNLQVSDSIQPRKSHVADTAGAVFQDFVGGMYDELKNHPGKLAAEAVAGAALTVGTMALHPMIRTAVSIAGAGVAVYEGATGIKNLADQTSIINNFDGSRTDREIAAAHQAVGRIGSNAMDFTAVAAGSGRARRLQNCRRVLGMANPNPFVDGFGIGPTVFDASLVSAASQRLQSDKI